MNKLLSIIFIGLLISCNFSKSKKNNTESINEKNSDSINKIDQIPKTEINSDLKIALRGVWASEEYKKILFKSNSITTAVKSTTFYTDIVFDGKEILHCNKPSFMEEDYLYIKPDSTVIDYNENLVFKIIRIENEIMEIKNSTNTTYFYKRVIENADLNRIFMEITKGTIAIENEWIANEYDVKLDKLDFKAKLLKNGDVKSNLDFKRIHLFSYLDKDLIEYRFENDSTLLYLIKTYSDTLITLQGVQNIEMDTPIVPNGKIGFMKKT